MSQQNLNDNKFILRDDGALDQTGYPQKIVNSLDDFPVPIGADIFLEQYEYVWSGTSPLITPYSFVFPAGKDCTIRSLNILTAPIVYVGSGTLIKTNGGVSTIRLINTTFAFIAGGQFIDVEGLDRLSTFIRIVDCICSGTGNLGRVYNITALTDNLTCTDYSQGFIADTARWPSEGVAWLVPKNVTKNTPCTFDNATNKILSAAHYMYDNDVIRFTTDGTLPTGLSAGAFDLNGAVIDNGDGTVRLTTTTPHGFSIGNTVFVRGTTYYDSNYEILATPTTTTFDIEATYVAETLANDEAQLGYYIINAATDDFQVSLTIGGAVVNFTDNGTGNHQFFENNIAFTARGSVYSFNFEDTSFQGFGANNTALDLEPTIQASGAASRGSSNSTLFENTNYLNKFTGSSLNQTYKYFTFFNTLGHPNSATTGVIYFTGNATPTPLTLNNAAPVVEPTYFSDNLERMEQIGNKLYYRGINPIALTITCIVTMTSGTALAKAIVLHIYKNGEDITVAEPVVDVLNRQVSIFDIEETILETNDYLEIWITNTTDSTDITVTNGKLIV